MASDKNPLDTLLQVGTLLVVAIFVGAGSAAACGVPLLLTDLVPPFIGLALVGGGVGLVAGLLCVFDSGHRFERSGMWFGLLAGVGVFSRYCIGVVATPAGLPRPEWWVVVLTGLLWCTGGFLSGLLSERIGRILAEFLDLE